MYRRVVSLIVLVAFLSYLWGCTSMRVLPREEMGEVEQNSSVWVTLYDGTQYEMKQPKARDSKLVGHVVGEGYREVDFANVRSIGIKRVDTIKTIVLTAVGITGYVLLMALIRKGFSPGGEEKSGDEPEPVDR